MELIQKSEWIEVEYREITDVMKEYTAKEDWMQPCFYYNEEYHWLSDFMKCHGNPWGDVDVPENIHGYDAKNYWNPIYIEVNDSGDFVKVYKK